MRVKVAGKLDSLLKRLVQAMTLFAFRTPGQWKIESPDMKL
jgi:hypothetical protein